MADDSLIWLTATRDDGVPIRVHPEVDIDDLTWQYLVPDGIAVVASAAVTPGDTVSGRVSLTDW